MLGIVQLPRLDLQRGKIIPLPTIFGGGFLFSFEISTEGLAVDVKEQERLYHQCQFSRGTGRSEEQGCILGSQRGRHRTYESDGP